MVGMVGMVGMVSIVTMVGMVHPMGMGRHADTHFLQYIT